VLHDGYTDLVWVAGVVLNGVTTVIYGSVPAYAAPERRTHALSVFYTIAIGAAAVAPPLSGFIGDRHGDDRVRVDARHHSVRQEFQRT
jgi:hypothetical protein